MGSRPGQCTIGPGFRFVPGPTLWLWQSLFRSLGDQSAYAPVSLQGREAESNHAIKGRQLSRLLKPLGSSRLFGPIPGKSSVLLRTSHQGNRTVSRGYRKSRNTNIGAEFEKSGFLVPVAKARPLGFASDLSVNGLRRFLHIVQVSVPPFSDLPPIIARLSNY